MNVVATLGTSATSPWSLQMLHGKLQQSHENEKNTSFSGLWDSGESSITPPSQSHADTEILGRSNILVFLWLYFWN